MPWVYLLIAGLLEVVWATGLKYSDGFSRPWPSVVTIVTMIASFMFLALAMKSLPLGTSYTVWTGIGAVGSIIVGIIFFAEPRDLPRLFFLALIVVGIVGVRLTTASGQK